VLAGWFYSGPIEQITQTWSGEAASADATFLPLDAWDLGALKGSPVASTFEGIHD
jgi:hypothetical protein